MLRGGAGAFLLRALVLLILGFLFYAPAVDNYWIKDDLAIGNLMEGDSMSWEAWIRELAPVGMSGEHYWRPVPLLPGYLEHALWGLDVRGYHLSNILMQILCAIALMSLVDRLGGGRDGMAGLGAGLLVLLAPSAGESVVWIMQRMVLMTSLFMLWGLLLWLRGIEGDRRGPRLLALFMLVLALLSKEIALVLPGLFFLLELMRGPNGSTAGQRMRSACRWALPSAALIALYFLLRYLFWGRLVNSYAGMEVMDYARHNRVFERFGATLLNGLLPANPDLLGRGPALALRAAMALGFGVALLRGALLWTRSSRHRLTAALGAALALLTILPIAPIVWVDERLFNARFFHGPMLGVAMIAAPALFARMPGRGAGLLDPLGRLAGMTLVIAYAVSLSAQLVAFDRASDQILGIRAGLVALQEERARLGQPAPRIVALDVPDQYLGVPTLEYSLTQAMKPPLTKPEVSVVALLARDRLRPGFWLGDLDRQIETRDWPRSGLVFVECRSLPFGVRPIFGPRAGPRGASPPRPTLPADLSYRGNGGAEPDFVFESSNEAAVAFRLLFRTPEIDFEFGPRLVPGLNCEEIAPGRFRFRPSMADPSQPDLPDLWERVVRKPLPRPLPLTWRIGSLDADGRTIALSIDQRLLVFDTGSR